LADKNYCALKLTNLQQNGSGLGRLLLLQRIEHRANVLAHLFLFEPSDRSTDHFVDFAILAVADEVLQLLGLGQFAELHSAVDRQRAV